MKKVILQQLIILIAFCFSASAYIDAANTVNLTVRDGVDGSIKKTIESTGSALLSQINEAYANKQTGLDLKSVNISQRAKESMAALWANVHFKCEDNEIIESCITTGNGYQVRQIPLFISPQGATTADDTYQEAVIGFDPSGQITSFYFTIGLNLYSKVLENKSEVTDVKRRMQILDYVEHFRTAYNEKDINFLNQVFSEDALIIVGKVVKTSPNEMNNFQPQNKVEFIKRTKKEYISNLQNVFAANKFINVKFDEIKVVRHPHPDKKDFYGVTLHQLYTSSTYSDDGYLFLLWDFRDENAPTIHVRTWQPKYTDSKKVEIATNSSDVFTISEFDIDI